MDHLDELEAEAIYIMREVAAQCEKPVMLYSIGKDSSVMLRLAMKAFYPEKPPFPFLHVNTTWKFKEMIEFRDRTAKELGIEMLEYINEEGVSQGINPFEHGSAYTDIMKTQALKQALDKYGFTAAFGGGRRDVEIVQYENQQRGEHSGVPAFQLDGKGHLAVHQTGGDPDCVPLFCGSQARREPERKLDNGG